jgi:uncharacterized protein (DUF2336 family)
VAVSLAHDVAEVADPMLQHSPVLNDEDLMEIVGESQALSSLLAIAKRGHVSEPLSYALVNRGEETVAKALADNDGANFSERVLMRGAELFPENAAVLTRMVQRYKLPLAAAERLFSKVSERVHNQLRQATGLSQNRLDDAFLSTEEWARIELSQQASLTELEAFIKHLDARDSLTPSLMLRALCWGHVRFFEACMAYRAEVKMSNARTLLHDPGPLGFKAIYKAANMPPGMGEAIRVLFSLASAEITEHGDNSRFPHVLLEGIMRGGYQQSVEQMGFIVALLGRNMSMGLPR